MALKKITEEEMNAQGVIAAPDILNGTPAQNKAIFDRMVRNLVAPAVNACAEAVDEVNDNQEEWSKQEQTRETNEEGRKTAEVRREEAEESRKTAEETRESNETERVKAEENRSENEQARRREHTAMTNAEFERAEAERLRKQAETSREENETKRAAAETTRNQIFAQMKNLVENLDAEAQTLEAGAEATVDVTVDPATGGYRINFGVPKGKDGEVKFEEFTPEQINKLKGERGSSILNIGDVDVLLNSAVVHPNLFESKYKVSFVDINHFVEDKNVTVKIGDTLLIEKTMYQVGYTDEEYAYVSDGVFIGGQNGYSTFVCEKAPTLNADNHYVFYDEDMLNIFGGYRKLNPDTGDLIVFAGEVYAVWYRTTNTAVCLKTEVTFKGKDGDPGVDGKSAYQYAQEAGYTGTEAEFAQKMAQKVPDVVQGAGQSENAVMSQKAVTDLVANALSGDADSAYETVDSIEEMVDTTKSYILSTTGTLWSWLPVETTVKVEKTEQIEGTEDNPFQTGRLSSGVPNSQSECMTTPYIDVLKYPGAFNLHLEGLGFLHTTSSNVRFSTYDESKNHITTQLTNSSAINTYTDNATLTGYDDGSVVIAFDQQPTASTGVTIGFMRFSAIGAIEDANVYVVYEDVETVMGDPQWTDTGIVVAEITEFALVNSSVKNYMRLTDYTGASYDTTEVTKYCGKDYTRKDLSLPAVLTWDSDLVAANYSVAIGRTEAFAASEAEIHSANTNRLYLHNLLPGAAYYYKVYALLVNGEKKLLKEGSFTVGTGPRMLHIEGIQNVRDIGGYAGLDGKTVKYGQIFRGSAMDEEAEELKRISGDGVYALLRCGVKTDMDLRSGRTASPLGIHGVDYINTENGYGNYVDAITNETHQKTFANLLSAVVTQLTAEKPCYIHCSGGCDRTGTLIFLLMGLLGVIESDLAKDYELSSFSPIGYTRTRNYVGTNINYPGMVSAMKDGYNGDTLTAKFEAFATAAVTVENNARTEEGNANLLDAAALINSFRALMLE